VNAPENIFVGNSASSKIIEERARDGKWENFFSCFGDKRTMNKPHGIYLIPIFSGEAQCGHWNLSIIEKKKKFCRAWVVDSLGSGSTTDQIAQNIKRLFSRTRVPCCWKRTKATRQSENECGPRMLQGMVSIIDAIRAGKDLDEAINIAEKADDIDGSYNSLKIRRKAASLMKVSEETKAQYDRRIAEMRRAMKKDRSRGSTGDRRIIAEEIVCID